MRRGALALVALLWGAAFSASAQAPDSMPALPLEVDSAHGAAWNHAFEEALRVELSGSRTLPEVCRPVRVSVRPPAADEARMLAIEVGGEPLQVRAEGSVRALALAAAEHIRRICGERAEAPDPWRDSRPEATAADRERYYGPMLEGRALAQGIEPGTVFMRGRIAPMVDVARGGFGLLGDLSVSAWLGGGVFVEAMGGPMGFAVGEGPGIGALGGVLSVGYDSGVFALTLGAGVGVANGVGPVDWLGRVDATLRIGYLPSAFARVRVSLAMNADRVELGLVSARFAIPLDRQLAITWNAEVGVAFASGRVDVGLQAWLLGDMTSPGLALEAGVGAGALAFVPGCPFGPCDNEWTLAVGPAVHLGLLARAGP